MTGRSRSCTCHLRDVHLPDPDDGSHAGDCPMGKGRGQSRRKEPTVEAGGNTYVSAGMGPVVVDAANVGRSRTAQESVRPAVVRLADHLRFGPMAHYMRGWSEEQRTLTVETLARDLIASGWIAEEQHKPRCTDCTGCGCQR